MSRKAAFFDPQIPIRSKFDRLRRSGFGIDAYMIKLKQKVLGIKIRTAEILTGTKTFQKAKTCIYNTDGMPVYVDIPTEYGKTWLKDLVTGNASICLELDQELKTDNHKDQKNN